MGRESPFVLGINATRVSLQRVGTLPLASTNRQTATTTPWAKEEDLQHANCQGRTLCQPSFLQHAQAPRPLWPEYKQPALVLES